MRTVKQQVIELVKAKLIEAFGGLANDGNGNELELPYAVIGILHDAIPDDFLKDTIIVKVETSEQTIRYPKADTGRDCR